LEFEADFPEVRVVRLERNYRSTKCILRVADGLIAHNVRRKQKSLHTENGEGQPVRLVGYADHDAEAGGIAARIRQAIDSGERRPSDFAIFYRVNALSRAVEKAMREAGIPFQMIRGQEFFQRKEIKDVLAYCQLANNPRDDVAFERTVNTPTRGIGKKSLERLAEHAYRYGMPMLDAAREAQLVEGIAKRAAGQLAAFVGIIDRITAVMHGDVEEVIGTVLEESGYRQSLSESDSEEDLNRLANIEELLTDAREYDEQNPEPGQLEAYLERSWLVNEIDNWETDTDKVTLMTLHAAKGLEFPVVFLVALEQGVLPHERSTNDPHQLEEERRLAFVGITRAKDELQLSYAVRRDFRGQRRLTIPSQFLMEMPRHDMQVVEASLVDDIDLLADEYSDDFTPDVQTDDLHADDIDQRHPVELELASASVESTDPAGSPLRVAAAAITTAAAMAQSPSEAAEVPRVSPDVFAHGMAVVHPEHGPGKIVALSGSGRNRRATVRFATAGEKRYVLVHSPLRPAGK
jgi:DNA helicase-2/ATP-dependent DNA helicase PcrA